MDSLGLLLRTPQAARTQLSISIAELGQSGVLPGSVVWGHAGEKLVALDTPCHSVGGTLAAVRSCSLTRTPWCCA